MSSQTSQHARPTTTHATIRIHQLLEAFVAYEKIAEAIAGRQPAIAKEALTRVQEKAPDPRLRDRAKVALEKIK